MSENESSRRNVLLGVAVAGVAVPVLAACGSSGSGDPSNSGGGLVGGGSGPDPSTPSGGSTHHAPQGTVIKASEIPVGGGTIFPDQQIVVTQPTAGQFKAFSAVCTHQGCLVSQVSQGEIVCGCHFSQYSIVNGQVDGGPAPSPLPEKTVKVTGSKLIVT